MEISEKAIKLLDRYCDAIIKFERFGYKHYEAEEDAALSALVSHIVTLEAENAALKADAQGNPRVYERKDGGGWGASFEVVASAVKFLSGNGEAEVAPDEVPF